MAVLKPILILLAIFISRGHCRTLPEDANSTNAKYYGSMAYILPPGLLPWIPLPITPRPTPAPLDISTFAPDVGEINIGDQRFRQNEFKYYRFELVMEGISVSLTNTKGRTTGFYSYVNPTPNESSNNGTILPGMVAFISSPQRFTYQSVRSVYISVKGEEEDNIAQIKVARGDKRPTTTTPEPITPEPTTPETTTPKPTTTPEPTTPKPTTPDPTTEEPTTLDPTTMEPTP